jgi:hypothetical protein
VPAALQEAGAPASLDPLQPRLRKLRTLGERCPADRRQLVATIKKALKGGVCLAAIMQKTSERNVLDECRREAGLLGESSCTRRDALAMAVEHYGPLHRKRTFVVLGHRIATESGYRARPFPA